MRSILLAGKSYKITGEIIKRAINPWKASIESAGREYSSFQNVSLEEYHDLRNGIGLESALPAESARTWFTEGIDFSTARSSVLGPLITTAGSFGVAPVKLIDFQDKTYAIGHNQISEWSGSAWTSRHTTLANPVDAIVIQDGTDEYLIVSSATQAIYTTDGTTWSNLSDFWEDFLVFTEADTNAKLTVTESKALAADADTDEDVLLYRDMGADAIDALDVDFEIYMADTSQANSQGGMAISSTANVDLTGLASTDIAVTMISTGAPPVIYLERGNAVAVDTWGAAAFNTLYYCTLTRPASNDTVTLKIYSDSARTTLLDTLTVTGYSTTKYRYIYGFINYNSATGGQNFDGYVQNLVLWRRTGYMADFANKLYFISPTGKRVSYSTAKDIKDYSGGFELAGNFGTVYKMFSGKLLADQTPVLYFISNRGGLRSLDITNEISYPQEIRYPPTTYAGHCGMYWNANIWVGTGAGIFKIAPGMATPIGPDKDDGLPSGYQGDIYDMLGVGNWLVFCVNGGSSDKSSILKRNASLGGNLQVYTTSAINNPIACMLHSPSSLYSPGRLWFGEGTNVKYMMFPDTTANVKQISTYQYVDDSGYGKFPIFRKLAAISKVALGVAAITKSCDANEYIEVFYGLNGAAPTTSLGIFNDSPTDTILTFGGGLGLEFYTIQFAIKLFRGGTNTNSPELESLMFYYYATPATINGWLFHILATEDDADEIISEFEAIRDTNLLVVFNETGDSLKTDFNHNVKLTTMPLRFSVENQAMREGFIEIDVQEIFRG